MKTTCPHCEARLSTAPFQMHFKGLFLLFSGVRCRQCRKLVKLEGMLPGMSLPYTDLFFKLLLIAYTVYVVILGFYIFIPVTVLVILLLNYGLYPILITAGILVVPRR